MYHHTERINADLYDAFSPRDCMTGRVALFGDKNIGKLSLTNLLVAGAAYNDGSTMITDWYARTNFSPSAPISDDISPLARALHAWASTAIVTLVVRQKLMLEAPLSRLLGPRPAIGIGGHPGLDDAINADTAEIRPETMRLAEKLYDVFCTAGNSGRSPDFSWMNHWKHRPWQELRPGDRMNWLAVAEYVQPRYIPVYVGVRDTLEVVVDADRSATGALLEALGSAPIAPQPLVWIHLAGLRSRSWY